MHLLRLADSDIPRTVEVYHGMFKISTIHEPKSKIRWLGLYPDSNTRSNKCKVVEFTQNTKMVALIHIYSNTKMVASIRDADEHKMFASDNEDA